MSLNKRVFDTDTMGYPGRKMMRNGADNQDLRIRKGRDLGKMTDKKWPKQGRKTRRVG